MKTFFNLLFVLLATIASSAQAADTPERVYTQKEIAKEEARIRDDILEKLRPDNKALDNRDQTPDNQRVLYGSRNNSTLLDSTNGLRFGVFEAFDEGHKIIAATYHLEHQVLNRFYFGTDKECKSFTWVISQYNKKDTSHIVEFFCSISNPDEKEKENDYVSCQIYFYHPASQNLYRLISFGCFITDDTKVTYKKGVYHFSVNRKETQQSKFDKFKRHFKLTQMPNKEWKVTMIPDYDDEDGGVEAMQKLPLEPKKYNLPEYIKYDR